MEKIKFLILKEAEKIGINLKKKALEDFQVYAENLVEWNSKINLTSITKPEEITIKHFLDSLTLLKYVDEFKKTNSIKVIDIGTGAGFPGIPIKIVKNNIELVLLDSLNKRLIFLKNTLEKLNLKAELIHLRAEEGGKQKNLREKFNIVISRAVAKLNILSEFCLPYTQVGGIFVAMKGQLEETEIENANYAIEKLGGQIEKIDRFLLPDGSNRAILIIKKTKETPYRFPRIGTKIKNNPLIIN